MSAPVTPTPGPSSAPASVPASGNKLTRAFNFITRNFRNRAVITLGLSAPVTGGVLLANDHRETAIASTAALGFLTAAVATERGRKYTLPTAAALAMTSGAISNPTTPMFIAAAAGTVAGVTLVGRRAYEDMNPANYAKSKIEWQKDADENMQDINEALLLVDNTARISSPPMTWAAPDSNGNRAGQCDERDLTRHYELQDLELKIQTIVHAIEHSALWKALDAHETSSPKHVIPLAKAALAQSHDILSGSRTVTVRVDGLLKALRKLDTVMTQAIRQVSSIDAAKLDIHPNEAKKYKKSMASVHNWTQGAVIALAGIGGTAAIFEAPHAYNTFYSMPNKISKDLASKNLKSLKEYKAALEAKSDDEKNDEYKITIRKLDDSIKELEERYASFGTLDMQALQAAEKRLLEKLPKVSPNDMERAKEELQELQKRIAEVKAKAGTTPADKGGTPEKTPDAKDAPKESNTVDLGEGFSARRIGNKIIVTPAAGKSLDDDFGIAISKPGEDGANVTKSMAMEGSLAVYVLPDNLAKEKKLYLKLQTNLGGAWKWLDFKAVTLP